MKGQNSMKKFTGKGKNLLKAAGLAMMLCTASMPVLAASSFGISCYSRTAPTSVKKNTWNNYSMSLTYNSTIWESIPLPTSCQLGIELPAAVFSQVRFVSGSSYMSFMKKTGSVTGETSYQCYKTYRVCGKATKSFKVTAKSVNSKNKSGKANMGTGKLGFGIKLNDYNRIFTVKTKK